MDIEVSCPIPTHPSSLVRCQTWSYCERVVSHTAIMRHGQPIRGGHRDIMTNQKRPLRYTDKSDSRDDTLFGLTLVN